MGLNLTGAINKSQLLPAEERFLDRVFLAPSPPVGIRHPSRDETNPKCVSQIFAFAQMLGSARVHSLSRNVRWVGVGVSPLQHWRGWG